MLPKILIGCIFRQAKQPPAQSIPSFHLIKIRMAVMATQPYIKSARMYSRKSPVHSFSGETNRLLLGHSSGTPELVSQSPSKCDK